MAHRCKSIAGQRVVLGPGEPIIPGCEVESLKVKKNFHLCLQ